MTIDEAIKVLRTARARGYTASLEGFDAASQLGEEALKWWKAHRLASPDCYMDLLPGETKD